MTTESQSLANDIVIERTFDAPRAHVWRCWSAPDHLMKWWGPKDLTSPIATIDFRVGGKYHFCMRMPDGKDFWSTGTYLEIAPEERIVCTDSFSDAEGNIVSSADYGMAEAYPDVLQMTLTFQEEDGETRFTLRHEGIPAGEMHTLCAQSWNESFDKLDALLAQMR